MSSTIIEVAIKLLSDHNCSEFELVRRLEKEFSDLPDVDARIESAVKRLRELHLINDLRLAESLAERYEKKGNRFITQVLKQKGVNDEVIAGALSSLGDEYARALVETRKKGARKRDESPEKTKNRLFRFLSGRGFSFEAITKVVLQLQDEGFFTLIDEDSLPEY